MRDGNDIHISLTLTDLSVCFPWKFIELNTFSDLFKDTIKRESPQSADSRPTGASVKLPGLFKIRTKLKGQS